MNSCPKETYRSVRVVTSPKNTMAERSPLKCIVIGSGLTMTECVKTLAESGFIPSCVITGDPAAARWASKTDGIAHVWTQEEFFLEGKGHESVEFLFSIVNPIKLSSQVLSLARQLAINYHDGPLPRYAGLHATNWAILNGETTHGVSWVEMTEKFDAGDILRQTNVTVTTDDTAFSLGLKCHKAAVSSFRTLCTQLIQGNWTKKPQNLEDRTYFSWLKKPSNGCIIDFNQTTMKIKNFVRALDFGQTATNTLGCPQVFIPCVNGSVLLLPVSGTSELSSQLCSVSHPGVLLSIDPDGRSLTVSALDGAICMQFDSHQAAILKDAVSSEKVVLNSSLNLPRDEIGQFRTSCKKSASYENVLVEAFREFEPTPFPYMGQAFPDSYQYTSVATKFLTVDSLEALNPDQKRRNGAVALAVMAAFLCRLNYSGQFGAAIYCPFENYKNLKLLKAYFTNLLPVTINLKSAQTAVESLSLIIEILEERSTKPNCLLSREALYRHHLSELNDCPVVLALSTHSVTAADILVHETSAQLVVAADSDTGRLELAFSREIAIHDLMESLDEHFLCFARNLAEKTNVPTLQLAVMNTLESNKISEVLTGETMQWPFRCLHHVITHWAIQSPNHVAIEDHSTEYTYAEVDRRSSALANKLMAIAEGRIEPVVALLLPRCADLFVAEIAAMKSGYVFTVLEPSRAKSEIRYRLTDSDAILLITQTDPELKLIWQGMDLPKAVIFMEGEDKSFEQSRHDVWHNDPRRAIYISYTSGTTGWPKGIVAEHGAVCNAVLDMATEYALSQDDRVLQYLRPGFDGSFCDSYPTLCCGATMVLHADDEADAIHEHLASSKITVCSFLPSRLSEINPRDYPNIRFTITGGQAVPEYLVKRWNDAGKGVVNCFGPTETTVVCAFGFTDDTAHLGRPVKNGSLFLFNNALAFQPTGVLGVLHVVGLPVARGYWKLPEKTKHCFTASPDGRGRMHRTGDLVFLSKGGRLIYRGRVDDQVKLHGYRLEPAGIKAIIAEQPSVAMVEVIAVKKERGQVHMVAYVTPESADVKEIEKHLLERFPAFCIPRPIIALNSMPVNHNGKVNRSRLLERGLHISAEEEDGSNSGRSSQLEQTVMETFAEVLEIDEKLIRPSTNFFHYRNSSLYAQKLTNRLGDQLQREISFETLYLFSTPRKLAVYLAENLISLPIRRQSGKLASLSSSDILAVTPVQHAFLFVDATLPRPSAYNVTYLMTLSSSKLLEQHLVSRAKEALVVLVKRHSSLRTSFDKSRNDPMQTVHEFSTITLPINEISVKSKGEALSLAHQFGSQRFDLSKTPLLRCSLFRTPSLGSKRASKIFVSITFHHISVDYESIYLFASEFHDLCNGMGTCQLETAHHYANTLPFSSVESQTDELQYWKNLYSRLDVKPTLFFRDFPADKKSYRCSVIRRSTDIDISALEQVAKDSSTVFSVLCSSIALLLSFYCREKSVLFGVPVSTRPDSANKFVGLFLNNVGVSVKIDRNRSVRELMNQVSRSVAAAKDHSNVPFHEVAGLLRGTGLLDQNQTFKVIFSYVEAIDNCCTRLEDDVVVTSEEVDNKFAKTELFITSQNKLGKLAFSVEYAEDVFDESTAKLFADTFDRNLRMFQNEDACKRTVGNLFAFVEPAIRSSTVTSSRIDVLDVIDQLPSCRGEKMAIDCSEENRSLTYAQLKEESHKLAAFFLERTRTRKSIGLYLRPSATAVIAILAALRANLSFIPLDPLSPPRRLAKIVESSADLLVMIISSDGRNVPSDVQKTCNRLGLPVYGISDFQKGFRAGMRVAVSCSWRFNDLCYIQYTSGSTGQPKAVEVTRDNVASLASWLRAVVRGDRWLFHTSLSFDISVVEIIGSLCQGSCLVIPRAKAATDLVYLADIISNRQVNVLCLIPHMWKQFLWYVKKEHISASMSCLKRCLSVGEALSSAVKNEFYSILNHLGVVLSNAYGPTEATGIVTCCNLSSTPSNSLIPIGRPAPGTVFYVLNKEMKPVSPGMPGELYIGGLQVSAGYRNNLTMTQNRFIARHEHLASCSTSLYRTGDLVRRLENGDIVFLRRLSHVAKVQGSRVELQEVREVILDIHGNLFSDIWLAVDSSGEYEDRLICYCVRTPSEDVDLPSLTYLQNTIASALPKYSIPADFRIVNEFPCSPSGKLSSFDLQRAPYQSVLRSSDPEMDSNWIDSLNDVKSTVTKGIIEVADKISESDLSRNVELRSLGIGSLTWMRFAALMNGKGFSVKIQDVMKAQRLSDLVKLLALEDSTYEKTEWTLSWKMAQKDRQLVDFIPVLPRQRLADSPKVNFVLLTGATGFLGPYLVVYLLNESVSHLYLLVRRHVEDPEVNSRVHASQSIVSPSLKPSDIERITVLEGDVSKIKLGLSDEVYASLAEKVDLVIHSAATVNMLQAYHDLREVNVMGTLEVIKFVAACKNASLHYVSTSGATIVDNNRRYYNAYTLSKWVSEDLVRTASKKGIVATISRPCLIGPSKNGKHINPSSNDCLFLRTISYVGATPLQSESFASASFGLLPVDLVAEKIVNIALHTSSFDERLHIFCFMPSVGTSIADAVGYLHSFRNGYAWENMELSQFKDELLLLVKKEAAEGSDVLSLFAAVFDDFADFVARSGNNGIQNDDGSFLDEQSKVYLAWSGDKEYFQNYLKTLIERRLAAPP
eukprot:m.91355 g.91355  ORF g.91355 m.91355 type:complete len:2668 (+) comp36682_c2_seq2:389-8392(+)